MKELQRQIQAIGKQMLLLASDLLRLISADEHERNALIERVKKTPRKIYSISRA